jgi:hypothetical protein
MSFNYGTVSEFSDANSIANPVISALAKAIQLPAFKGALYQKASPPMVPIKQKTFEVYSRSKTTRNGVIGTAGSGTDWGSTSDTTALPIAAAYLVGLSIGHVLKVDSEVMVISAIDRSGNTIDVHARGAGGTTAATHTTGAAFSVIGFAGRDADLKNVTASNEATLKYTNYVQSVFEVLDWKKGAELQRQGLSAANAIAVIREEAAIRVAEMLSAMAVNGVKQLGADGGTPYMSAGLLSQLEDTAGSTRPILRYNASSAALSETILKGALDTVFATGSPDTIVCSLAKANLFAGFLGAGKDVTIQTGRDDTGAGRWVDHYDYNGIRLGIMVDADMVADKVAIVTMGKIRKGWLEGDMLNTQKEPDLSSREHRESITGSVGFLVEDVGYDHIEIYGLT